MTPITSSQEHQDSAFLHFLKEFPAWIALSILFLIVLGLHRTSGIQFYERIIDLLAGGLLTALIGRRQTPSPVNAGTTTDGNVINVSPPFESSSFLEKVTDEEKKTDKEVKKDE